MGRKLKININSAAQMKPHVHGRHHKDVIVLHETVSPDIRGLADVKGNLDYLAKIDYGIHGVVDSQGYIAWALGLGDAIFYQAGGDNTRSVGIEQVSNVMLRSPSNAVRRKLWVARKIQLRRTAQLCAAICQAWKIPIRFSDGDHPGITTHWNVSQNHPESEGHTDCWPVHLGGYYPALEVVSLTRTYAKLGYHF